MKRPTFRLDETKHRKLMSKLTLNGESFQQFGEYVVDLYLDNELQIKKESEEMFNVKEYVEGIKEHWEYNKIIDLSDCEVDSINYIDILNELDNQNINHRIENYYNEHNQLKSLPSMSIYCEQFYIEQ